MKIRYYNRYTKNIETEAVYGDKAIQWMYQNFWGKCFGVILTMKFCSVIYGFFQNLSLSKKTIKPFVEKFNIPLDDFIPQEGRKSNDPYSSFNHFFIRRFHKNKRNFIDAPSLAAFSEGRYFGHKYLNNDISVPVKGDFLSLKDLLQKDKWCTFFENGPILIARLCPVDYHRFHFPDDGVLLDHYPIQGKLHSVNPMAVKRYASIFCTNKRIVSVLETVNFGKIAYIEIGAVCVGRIVHTFQDTLFKRGQEKGYFLFGGSTIIVVGQKGQWVPSNDILQHTHKGRETYIHLGDSVGQKIPQ